MRHKHSTVRDGKKLVWYADMLWERAKNLIPFEIAVDDIPALDQNCWFFSGPPTLREVANHVERIESADLGFPIILNDDGTLMDGGHRICKALIRGLRTVQAVQFAEMPEPDEIRDVDA
jgi:hypothetical protein